MPNPCLIIDVSNSFTKMCTGDLGTGELSLSQPQRIPTRDITIKRLKELREKNGEIPLAISSVVPRVSHCAEKAWEPESLVFLNHQAPLGIEIDYPQPEQIGADRLANAVAATELYEAPAVVVDFGTAVTFDIISRDRQYVGGVIAPGLDAMRDYLHERTALLPSITFTEPERIIAKSTTEAMKVGAVVGYRGLIQEILGKIQQEMDEESVQVITTGGYSDLIAEKLEPRPIVNPLLTLQGVLRVARNQWSSANR